MRILDSMSFDPSWLLEPAGILITIGVISLLIALILLVTASKREEKKEETAITGEPKVQNSAIPQQPQGIPVDQAIPNPNEPKVEVKVPEVNVPTSTPVETIEVPKEEPKIEIFEPTVEPVQPVTSPVIDTAISSDNNSIPTLEINNNQPPVMETIIPNEVKVETPVVNEPAKPSVSIYGGVSPTADLYKTEEHVKPVIYGGADPLENTSPIPKVDSSTLYNQLVSDNSTKIIEPIPTVEVNNQTAVMDNSVTDTIPATSSITQEKVETPTYSSPLFEQRVEPSQEIISPPAEPKEEIETLDF